MASPWPVTSGKTDQRVPIIFLTAKSMKQDTINGFLAGADDYITKPFGMEELLLRIQAVLRRSQGIVPRGGASSVLHHRPVPVRSAQAIADLRGEIAGGAGRTQIDHQGKRPASACSARARAA
jgi:DNA-binding response OmpR family regulator